MSDEQRRLRIMRLALTRATARWGMGGRLKSQGMVKPVTLAGKPPMEEAEGQIVRLASTGHYHVKIIRPADGKSRISSNGFATVEEAERALEAWIKENGGRIRGWVQDEH